MEWDRRRVQYACISLSYLERRHSAPCVCNLAGCRAKKIMPFFLSGRNDAIWWFLHHQMTDKSLLGKVIKLLCIILHVSPTVISLSLSTHSAEFFIHLLRRLYLLPVSAFGGCISIYWITFPANLLFGWEWKQTASVEFHFFCFWHFTRIVVCEANAAIFVIVRRTSYCMLHTHRSDAQSNKNH